MKVLASIGGAVVELDPQDLAAAPSVPGTVDDLLESSTLSSGAALGVSLMADAAVLNLDSFRAAAAHGMRCYSAGEWVFAEWKFKDGWRDRRVLPPRTQALFERHRGPPSLGDLHEIEVCLKARFAQWAHGSRLNVLLGGLVAHWAMHMPPLLIGHAVRACPFQPLDRGAWARLASGSPLLGADPDVPAPALQLSERVQSLCLGTRNSLPRAGQALGALLRRASQLSSRRGSNAAGRIELSALIDELLQAAAAENTNTALLLGAARHLIDEGGIDGKPLALTTLDDYLHAALPPLQRELANVNALDLSASDWQGMYLKVIQAASPSQRGKLAACLEALHRFLVLGGVEPLGASLVQPGLALPPAAAIIWPAEFERAMAYAEALAPTQQVRWQACLILRLAYLVPCRVYDPWGLTLKDVRAGPPLLLDMAPRIVDGGSKTPAARRQVEVADKALAAALLDARKVRQMAHCAVEDDLLLGDRGEARRRHQPELTMQVVNRALRLATGARTTSFYDLRHSSISRRAEQLLCQPQGPTDTFAWQDLAAWAGHASSKSTVGYTHLFEESIARHGAAAMPNAWAVRPRGPLWDACFPPVERGRTANELPPVPEPLCAAADPSERLSSMFRFFDYMARGDLRVVSAARSGLAPEVAAACIRAFEIALDESGLVPDIGGRMESERDALPEVFRTFCRAAKQAKYAPISRWIGATAQEGGWRRLEQVWRAWCQCRSDAHIGLDRPNAAIAVLQMLLDAGLLKRQLVWLPTAPAARPIDARIARLVGARRAPQKPRPGLPAHRLALVDSHKDPRECVGASASVLGLHWLMLLMRVATLTLEDRQNG